MSQPVPQPGTYALDPDLTTIRADVKAMFGLLTVHGTFRLKDGQVIIAEDPAVSRARAVIDAGRSRQATRPGMPTSSRPACWTRRPTRRSASTVPGLARTARAGW